MTTSCSAQLRSARPLAVLLVLFVLLALLVPPAGAQLPGGGAGGAQLGAGPVAELQEGIRLLRAGENEAAKRHFDGMAARDPEGSMPRYYLALAHAALGEGAECVAALDAAAERGWPRPETLASDPGFAALRERNEEFRRGLEGFASAWRARNEAGILPGRELPGATWLDEEGKSHPLVERGRATALLFLRADEPQDLAALFALSKEAEGRGEGLRAVVLVECPDKDGAARRERLARFRRESGVALPCGLATDELRRLVRPFRAWPTLLWIDPEGRARRVVEGFPPDLEARYSAVIRERGEPAEGGAGEGKPAAEPPVAAPKPG